MFRTKIMDTEQLLKLIQSRSAADQLRFYSLLSLNLTVRARETYGREDAARLLQGFNELQHKVLGQIAKLATDDANRYPDEVFVKTIFDIAEKNGLSRALSLTLDSTRTPVQIR
jgi:hypothetical protein